MNEEGIDRIKKIREKEESINKSIEEAKLECRKRTESERNNAEKAYRDLENSLQIKYDLAVKEKKVEFEKIMASTVSEEKENASRIKLNIDKKSIMEMLFTVMKEYLSE